MTITDLKIAQVRRMVNEPDDADYTGEYDNVTISGYLTDYDEDLNAVASVIWYEKAAVLQATAMDFSTEGESYRLNQTIENAKKLARDYASQRLITTALMVKFPEDTDDDDETITNLG